MAEQSVDMIWDSDGNVDAMEVTLSSGEAVKLDIPDDVDLLADKSTIYDTAETELANS